MLGKLMGALVIALGITILGANVVFGHADYESSTPNDGETVTDAPSQVVATFSADLDPAGTNTLNVTDESGADVDNNDGSISASNEMTITLQSGLANGVYTVAWATTSAEDGEEDDGTFTFTVEATSTGGAATSTPATGATPVPSAPTTGFGPGSDDGSSSLLVIVGLALVGALAVMAGGVAFSRFRA